MVTITTKSDAAELRQRKGIVLTARVHPGETVSSYIIKGVIDYLCSDTPTAQLLRNRFIFKIIPMLNPDGVIHGNNRCSLAGVDLNRQWKKPSKTLTPEIEATKVVIMNLARNNDVVLFCDFHGHSIKKNAFIYGCHDAKNPLSSRLFPYILSRLDPSFAFDKCKSATHHLHTR
jgi:murein tripeptide amidase MpaA